MPPLDSPKNDLQLFCENVVYIRKKYRITLTSMARRLHTTVATLKRIENGEMPKKVTVEMLINVCQSFGYRPSELFLPFCGEI